MLVMLKFRDVSQWRYDLRSDSDPALPVPTNVPNPRVVTMDMYI